MTYVKDNIIHIGDTELIWLVSQFIKEYRFTHKNERPAKILLPSIKEVDGVPVEVDWPNLVPGNDQENRDAIGSGQVKQE